MTGTTLAVTLITPSPPKNKKGNADASSPLNNEKSFGLFLTKLVILNMLAVASFKPTIFSI